MSRAESRTDHTKGLKIKKIREEEYTGIPADDYLPLDVWKNIASFLDAETLENLRLTSKGLAITLRTDLLKQSKPQIRVVDTKIYYLLIEELYVWDINSPNEKAKKIKFPKQVKIQKIYTSHGSIFALTTEGEVYAWGKNLNGQLGIGNRRDQDEPKQVKFPRSEKITHLYTDCFTTHKQYYGEAQYTYVTFFRSENENIYRTGNECDCSFLIECSKSYNGHSTKPQEVKNLKEEKKEAAKWDIWCSTEFPKSSIGVEMDVKQNTLEKTGKQHSLWMWNNRVASVILKDGKEIETETIQKIKVTAFDKVYNDVVRRKVNSPDTLLLEKKEDLEKEGLLSRLVTKWHRLPTKWKVLAGVILSVVGIGMIVTAILCPPSLAISLPLMGKVAVSTVVLASGTALAAATVGGHIAHTALSKLDSRADGADSAGANNNLGYQERIMQAATADKKLIANPQENRGEVFERDPNPSGSSVLGTMKWTHPTL